MNMLSKVFHRRKEPEMGDPFYSLPQRMTSAQIIKEARTALDLDRPMRSGVVARVGVRTVHTRRPFTPREKERTLFGRNVINGCRESRPPSSFTLSPLNFDPTDVISRTASVINNDDLIASNAPLQRPSSRLLPLLTISANDVSGPSRSAKRRVHRYQFRTSLSLCDLPEETEEGDEGGKSNSRKILGVISKSSTFSNLNQKQLDDLPTAQPFLEDSNPLLGFKGNTVNRRLGVSRDWKHSVGKVTRMEKEEEENLETEEEPRKETRKELKVDQAVYFEERIAPVLDEVNRAISCGVDDELLAELMQKLYNILEAGGLLGRHFHYRTQVLKTIFKLVDRENGNLLATLARIMLALKVRGSNLTSVCKLVFKVTRHDNNDNLFLEGNLLDLVLEAVACASPLEQSEACVYGYGALKFLTMNSQLVGRLLHRGVLELLVLHMKLIITEKEESGSVPDETGYALVQLTGTLRHVSSCERAFPLLLVTGAVEQVCRLLQAFHDDAEVTANIVRILSIISTQEECCLAAAATTGTMDACMKALQCHSDHPAVVVRLAYALGNMMANSDEARWELYNVEGFTDTILSLLAEYLRKDREEDGNSILDPLASVSGSPEDVLIKLIRVLANVSVHPEVGAVLANSKTCLSMLVSLVSHKTVDESEELVLSALATLNNLTFYTRLLHPPTTLHMELAESLCETLPMDHVEGLVETIRVFGNLTHSKEVRDILSEKEVLEVLIEMLDCDSRELVFVCAGVLVNMMSDLERRTVFQKEKGVLRMIDVLQYFGYGDWQLCSLVCQVLWNYCASSADISESFDAKEAGRLTCVMEEFLDDDTYFKNPEVLGLKDDCARDAIYMLWEDFAAVATKLLDRIEENASSFENQC